MKITWQTVLGAIAISIVSGVVVNWLSKKFGSPARQNAQHAAWCCYLNCGALPNLNRDGASPANSYPHGAPVTNHRSYLRIGQTEVSAR